MKSGHWLAGSVVACALIAASVAGFHAFAQNWGGETTAVGQITASCSFSWIVPAGDEDCDGFPTDVENYMGTDAADACPDDTLDNAWPPDFDDDQDVDISDVLQTKPHFGSPASNLYSARYDLDADGDVDIFDVLQLKPFFNLTCTP